MLWSTLKLMVLTQDENALQRYYTLPHAKVYLLDSFHTRIPTAVASPKAPSIPDHARQAALIFTSINSSAASESLALGNGFSGTGLSNMLHNGAQPSLISIQKSLSGGTILATCSL